MKKLSTGDDSTLGNYRKLCVKHWGEVSKAVQFVDAKIASAPGGENEEVVSDERQMVNMLMNL